MNGSGRTATWRPAESPRHFPRRGPPRPSRTCSLGAAGALALLAFLTTACPGSEAGTEPVAGTSAAPARPKATEPAKPPSADAAAAPDETAAKEAVEAMRRALERCPPVGEPGVRVGAKTPLLFTVQRPTGWEMASQGDEKNFALKFERPLMADGASGRARIAFVQMRSLALPGPLRPARSEQPEHPILLRFGDHGVPVYARRLGTRAAYKFSVPVKEGGTTFFYPVEVQVSVDAAIADACAYPVFALAEAVLRTVEAKPARGGPSPADAAVPGGGKNASPRRTEAPGAAP